MKMSRLSLAFALCALCAAPLLTYAHAFGQSLEQAVDEKYVDIGYDAISTIQVGDPVRFDFNLWKEKEKINPVAYNAVWVQIIGPDKRVGFTADIIHPDIGLTTASYRFMQIGTYTLFVRFEDKDENTITQTSFDLPVEAGNTFGGFGTSGGTTSLIAGLVIGAALMFFLLRRRG